MIALQFRKELSEMTNEEIIARTREEIRLRGLSQATEHEYLGRYTHRIAISNNRIINVENDHVTFKWRDYRDNNIYKTMTISAFEFIRRFLLHVLPIARPAEWICENQTLWCACQP